MKDGLVTLVSFLLALWVAGIPFFIWSVSMTRHHMGTPYGWPWCLPIWPLMVAREQVVKWQHRRRLRRMNLAVAFHRAPWGYRIDLITAGADSSVFREPIDPELVGALALHELSPADLSPVLARQLDEAPVFQTHSYLRDDRRGSGLGVLLYGLALELGARKGWSIVSNEKAEMTDAARRLWKSRRLRALFDIGESGGRYFSRGQRSRIE